MISNHCLLIYGSKLNYHLQIIIDYNLLVCLLQVHLYQSFHYNSHKAKRLLCYYFRRFNLE